MPSKPRRNDSAIDSVFICESLREEWATNMMRATVFFTSPCLGLTGRRHHLGVGLDGLRRPGKHFAAAYGRGNCGGTRCRTADHGSTGTGGCSHCHRHASASGNARTRPYSGAASHTGLYT